MGRGNVKPDVTRQSKINQSYSQCYWVYGTALAPYDGQVCACIVEKQRCPSSVVADACIARWVRQSQTHITSISLPDDSEQTALEIPSPPLCLSGPLLLPPSRHTAAEVCSTENGASGEGTTLFLLPASTLPAPKNHLQGLRMWGSVALGLCPSTT